jgi:hypothetical protein
MAALDSVQEAGQCGWTAETQVAEDLIDFQKDQADALCVQVQFLL